MKYNMKIFNNNLNNNSKIISLKRKKGNLGKTKYFPSFSKEWKNIIYCYNQNNLKNIPVNNVNINKIIKSYFNLYFKNHTFVSRYKKFILLKRRKNFLNRIFVSNAEIKHTNNKALITLYTVNREILIFRKRYLKFNKKISKNLIRRLLRLYKKIIALLPSKQFVELAPQNALISSKTTISSDNSAISESYSIKNKYLNEYLYFTNQNKDQLIHKKSFFNYKLKHFNKYIKYQNIYLKKTLNFIINKYLKIYFKFLRKYDLMYSLNKYKFNKQILLPILSNILNKILKKKIEYNIINLKSITYNTDIFTNALALKLKRKKKISALKNMFKILNRAYLPSSRLKSINYFNYSEGAQAPYGHNTSDQVSLTDKSAFSTYQGYTNLQALGGAPAHKNINLRHELLNALHTKSIQHYDIKNIHKYDDLNLISILNNGACTSAPQSYKNLDKLLGVAAQASSKQVHNIIYNSIGYKKMRGIRIEIKGRLTKRYRADRSIYSLKWKGGLKNVDSSFKGLSSILFRGNSNSNVSYSVCNSKRRIGAFAVKGWISGY